MTDGSGAFTGPTTAGTGVALRPSRMAFLRPLFALFFSPLGLALLAAVDASLVFFLPFGVDAVLISLVASDPDHAWLYTATATAGSLAGGTLTFLIGRRLGGDGIKKF